MNRNRFFVSALSLAFVPLLACAAPMPGDVYREYVRDNGGDLDWRVTDSEAVKKFPRAEKFLPNPKLSLVIDDLEDATRAELLVDRWGGHRGTINKRVRFNQRSWVNIPEIADVPDGIRPEQLMFQDNPVVEIPLEDLVEGENFFEGDCDEEGGFGWGQWGLYSALLRVYYDPAKKADRCDFDAAIASPSSGDVFPDSPLIKVEADGKNGIARVDLVAYCHDFDFDGDGNFTEWQESHFQLVRGGSSDIRDHIGTLWSQPYQQVWDTHWLPDQQPGAIKLVARVQDAFGYWTVTEPVVDLTLRRTNTSVQLYPAVDVPEDFDVRVGETKQCRLPIPAAHRLRNAVEAAVHLRTWHGLSADHSPIRLNNFEFPAAGKNHHFDYDLIPLSPLSLIQGDNVFSIHSDTEHHMLEVLWPGPAIVVRYDISKAQQPMTALHPQAQEFVDNLAADPPPAWRDLPVSEARDVFDTFRDAAGPSPETVKIEDRVVADDVPVRIYRGSSGANATPVVYFHGGGWVLGNIESHDPLCRRLAAESGATVISVDYRLAPEFPFPAPLDDCYSATQYVAEHADELRVDASRLVVAGDSAGGNLAAAVAIRARDEGGPKIVSQLLLYPVIAADFTTPSYEQFAEGHGLTRDAMQYFWECYLGSSSGQSPALADLSEVEDMVGLPPAHVFLASHDVLHDEGVAFANRLADAGVTTTTKTYPGTLHGFIHFAGLFDDGMRGSSDVAKVIRSVSQ